MSPDWVYSSLREGRQQRCLVVSADTSRHLPSIGAGGAAAAQGGAPSASGAGTSVPSSRQARAELLSQLEAEAGPDAAGHARPLLRQGSMPAVLLAGVAWSVTDPPQAARLDRADAGAWDVGGAECVEGAGWARKRLTPSAGVVDLPRHATCPALCLMPLASMGPMQV